MAIFNKKTILLYSRGLESWELSKEIQLDASTIGEMIDLVPIESSFAAFTTKGVHKMNQKSSGFSESLEVSNIKQALIVDNRYAVCTIEQEDKSVVVVFDLKSSISLKSCSVLSKKISKILYFNSGKRYFIYTLTHIAPSIA